MIYLKKHVSKVFLSIVPIFLISITVASMTNKGTNSEKITIAEATVNTVSTVQTNYTEIAETTDSPIEEYRYSAEIPLSRFLQITMQNACREYGVTYTLALAVAECESSFDLEADSGTCYGLMQINPINYDRLRSLGIEPTEHEGNIVAGVYMLGELLGKYGDTHKALMAYNCGETGAARLWEKGYTASSYSEKVINTMEKWQQILNDN